MRAALTETRLRLLVALLWAALVATAAAVSLGARPAAAGETIVRVSHHHDERPLEAEVWTDRGDRAVYHPGDDVHVRFQVSDDAYVCVYNIDTEGRLRVIFPSHPGDDGYVRGGRVIGLPAPDADYDFTASGPPGMELLVIVASRSPLVDPWPWCPAVVDEHGHHHDMIYSEVAYHDDGGVDWSEPEVWYELDSIEDDDWVAWRATRGEHAYGDCAGHVPWGVHGLLVTGDPFVAMQRINRQLVPRRGRDGDVGIGYGTFHIERQVQYPRYLCGDCHGRWTAYDPYADRCSVFSVEINTGWRRYPRPVVIIHERPGPRYIYVRHERVAPRNRGIRRTWRSNERNEIQQRFRDLISDGRVPPIGKSTQVYPKERREKSTHGYDWKTVRYRDRSKSTTGGKTSEFSKRVRRSAEAWKEARGKQRTAGRTRTRGSDTSDAGRVRKADSSRGKSYGTDRPTKVRQSGSGKSKPSVAKQRGSGKGSKSTKVRSGGSGKRRTASAGSSRSRGGGSKRSSGSGKRLASGDHRSGGKRHR